MNEEGYRSFLYNRNIPEEKIEQFISIVEKYEDFLKNSGKPGYFENSSAEDIRVFSQELIKEKLNTYENYRALYLYGMFAKENSLFTAVVELVDGYEVMESLYEKLGESLGEEIRDIVFYDLELPPIGTPPFTKPKITQTVIQRLEEHVDAETCQKILSSGLRRLGVGGFSEERQKYLACQNLDEFLDLRGNEFLAELEHIKNEGRLYFTQEITDGVIEFVREHPEIRQGVRQGDVLYEIKIPYMAKEYLSETDERMRRYYYCHCPWVRESLKAGDVQVSPTFCHCSAGFHKRYWEEVLDQPLQSEIIETVLKGDPWCKIAIHLPEGLAITP